MNIMDIATALNTLTPTDLEELAANLNFKTSDNLYSILYMSYVTTDVEHRLNELEMDIPDDILEDFIDACAFRYVYDCDYDCNLSYWDNIDNLINDEYEKVKKG